MIKKKRSLYSLTQLGQTTIEYILLLGFIVILATVFGKTIAGFMTQSFGNLAHVLSYNLSTGSCPTECFFDGYFNGHFGAN